jgi:acyl-CoA thioesterase-1
MVERLPALWAIAIAAALSGCGTAPAPSTQTASPTAQQHSSEAAEPSAPEASSSVGPGAVRYLSLGDSLTQGIGAADLDTGTFPALLAEKWRAAGCEVELQNAGISGYTAGQVLSDQVPSIADFQPTVITFQAGGNDIATSVPLDEYRKNVKAVLDAASGSGAEVIVLAQNEWFRSPDGQNYGENQAA